MDFRDGVVNYEAFGAQGDGVTDDLPAICEAHDYANAHDLGVRTKPDATYYIGGGPGTAVIATDTDWNTSRFTIDDSGEVEDNKATLFEVRSLLEPEELKIDRLTRDQKQVDARLPRFLQCLPGHVDVPIMAPGQPGDDRTLHLFADQLHRPLVPG